MELTIKCECGNYITFPIKSRKKAMLRDNLGTKKFRLEGMELYEQERKEIRIKCDICRNWITLDLN